MHVPKQLPVARQVQAEAGSAHVRCLLPVTDHPLTPHPWTGRIAAG
jgi:hypothetical protein